MKKMLMLATTAAMIEQFNKNNILILEYMGYEVHVAGNWMEGNPISTERLEEFKDWLEVHHAKWHHITATRRPTDFKNNRKAYHDVVKMIQKYHYEFIHCHTPIGSVIGRLAAKRTSTKIIYTAHGFHFFKGAPLKNWLLYFPVEWICSWMTDVLITINTEDYKRAKKHLHAKRTEYIPGVGVDIERFAVCHVDKKKKCKELGIPDDKFILLSVGELQERKNHRVVIDALGKMQNRDIYYLIAGQGALQAEYEQLIEKYKLTGNIILLGYRADIDELCEIADCFVHTAFHEGFSVALLEAMASGLPIIGSNVRGVRDLIEPNKSGIQVRPNAIDEVQNAIWRMHCDKNFREKCSFYNVTSVKKYSIENAEKIMCDKYKTIVWGGAKHLEMIVRAQIKRKEFGISADDFVIISVGELNSNKNHEIMIKAISELKDSHIKYIICGQGELAGYLECMIKRYKLNNQIMMVGYRTDIDELLRMSDLFAFPSKREGLSMALMEAMACGLPVICYAIRGNIDLIKCKRNEYGKINTTNYWIEKIKKMMGLSMADRRQLGLENQIKINKFSILSVESCMKSIYEMM